MVAREKSDASSYLVYTIASVTCRRLVCTDWAKKEYYRVGISVGVNGLLFFLDCNSEAPILSYMAHGRGFWWVGKRN